MSSIILLWILVPAALFLTMALYVISIGFRTRNANLRGEPPVPAEPGPWPALLTVRGLNGPRK
ncbi:hypothetical protein [Actinomadura sp. BRA 177]|uniref:hypothetical protein n=1 Tax=Actinomadura sp. BRA 177 TaxID=2745202 RepID=UPI001595F726|nr:hypothetical protein [Actinomadura sp. BRA 177]NVI90497.1 hypothetical protein [Actinomadura sp. BRA 177]